MRDGRRRGVRLVGRARVPGGTWRRAQTSGPSQDATLASGDVGLRKFRIAQLLREMARAACARGIGTRTKAAALFPLEQKNNKFRKVSSEFPPAHH